jgi:hypothetical protein
MTYSGLELLKISTFALKAKVSRQNIYGLIKSKTVDEKNLDGVKFIIMNQKAADYLKSVKKGQ